VRGVACFVGAKPLALQFSRPQIKVQAHFIFQFAFQRIGAKHISQAIKPSHCYHLNFFAYFF